MFGAAEQGFHGADDPTHEKHDDDDENCGESSRYVWMARGQPSQTDGEGVFSRLNVMFENGSGDGVTAARAAVLPLWAIRATAAPRSVASSWCSGESWRVAW